MLVSPSRRHSGVRQGVAAVEMSVVLPFLLLLLLGVWEVGRMVEVQQLLCNAVREGGRQASTGAKTVAQVKADVVLYLTQNGISKVTTNDVTVTNITDDYAPILPNFLLMGTTIKLRSKSLMLSEAN